MNSIRLFLLSLALALVVKAQQPPPRLPACAFPCIEALAGGRMATTSTARALVAPDVCLASRDPSASLQIQTQIQNCLLQQCSPAESLETVRAVADLCSWPVRSRKASLLALFAIQIPAVLCLGLRLYDRIARAARYAVDDYLIMAVAPLFVTFLAVGQYGSVVAFGVDVWTVPDGTIAAAMQAFYVDEMLYLAILALVRLSILFLYLRLFAPQPPAAASLREPHRRSTSDASAPSTSTSLSMSPPSTPPETPTTASARQRYRTVYYYRFRAAVLVIAAILVVLPTVVVFFLDIFQCHPVRTVWTRWTSASPVSSLVEETTCLDVRALAYVAASFGIVQDVAILLVPWPLLFVLRHSLFPSVRSVTALTALAMFSLGIFVLITSCVRLHFLVHFNPTTTTNPTWDNTDSLIWSGLEVSVSVIVACLPAVRAMVQAAYRNRRGTL
ncbi:cfem domain-containing protein [Ophiostoma piceae UAMH 11346]|uniref:Cfem domain-containing protein n=1 Tax=Ophiostoma piceae (strain UAMH 11346) TaxID=1262450 RepID=S3C0T9_OPHP1|nr:cfem domain-containing protein [Ophiostoma piceae UAMH 11346]